MENKLLVERLKSVLEDHRYRHSLGVAETAAQLAEKFGEDIERAVTAGLLHDILRDEDDNAIMMICKNYGIEPDQVEKAAPNLLHGKAGAEKCREFWGVTDEVVLNAIRCHTTGRREMTVLDKILFMADMIEPGRSCPGVEYLRQLAFSDLDQAVIAGLDSTIRYVLARGLLIHPSSIEARNCLLIQD